MERQKKTKVVEELGSKLKELDCLFLADFSGMNVSQVTKLRRELRNVNTDFTVVKNTLLRIASKGKNAEALYDKFDGPNAIICTNADPTGPAKVIAGLAKEMPNLKMKAGYIGNRTITAEDIQKLATLPSKEVLLGKFVGLLKGQPTRLVYALSGNLNKLMLVLNSIKAQKEQQA
ncbi:MAG: 50S ribosomal protein L10 [Syntrophorhabdaceae bacterium]